MDERTAMRSWWRKKRWVAGLAVWLVVAYPLSLWPVAYLVGVDAVPESAFEVYRPLEPVLYVGDESRFGCGWYNEVGYQLYQFGRSRRFEMTPLPPRGVEGGRIEAPDATYSKK